MQDSALNLQGRVCELDGELDSYFEQGLILYNMLEFRKKTKWFCKQDLKDHFFKQTLEMKMNFFLKDCFNPQQFYSCF